jgi:hypothetical protein
MNRCRFLRYDVFFLGTALSMPSQISASDGIAGSDSDGIASAPNGVVSAPNGCDRRCRKGVFRTGRMGPLRPGSSVCHSGGSGRVRAMAGDGGAYGDREYVGPRYGDGGDGVVKCVCTPVGACRSRLAA